MRKSTFSRTEIDSAARPEKTRGFGPENAGRVGLSGYRDRRRTGDVLGSADYNRSYDLLRRSRCKGR